jgi:hypothetical protein
MPPCLPPQKSSEESGDKGVPPAHSVRQKKNGEQTHGSPEAIPTDT